MTQDLSRFRRALAGVCGEKGIPQWDVVTKNFVYYLDRDFEPWEDVAQAIRVLEAWRDKACGDWRIESKPVAGEMAYWIGLAPFSIEVDGEMKLRDGPLPRAIVLAVIQALDLKEDV